jgi:hypothetical protein
MAHLEAGEPDGFALRMEVLFSSGCGRRVALPAQNVIRHATYGAVVAKSLTTLASELIAEGLGGLEELHVHEFEDAAAAHDDNGIERLYVQFKAELDAARAGLSRVYGNPLRTGTADDRAIPLNGVFCFAVWDVDGTELFVAATHEEREVPILLMIGTV